MDFYSIFTIRPCSKSHQCQAATHIEEKSIKSIEGNTLVKIQILFYNNVMKIHCCTMKFMARAYEIYICKSTMGHGYAKCHKI